MKILLWLKSSFDNSTIGASARKLTAFTIILLIITSDIIYLAKGNFTNFNTYLVIHFVSAAFFLGLITVENLIKFFKTDSPKDPD